MQADPWTQEIVFDDGDAFFGSLEQAIDQARSTVDLETYIFDEDALGKRMLDTLARAVARGVKVRLMLDGVGSSAWTSGEADKFRKFGIEIKFFHPMPWQRHAYPFWKFLTIRKLALGFYKLNHRNHRKTCVIDSTTAFVGSMNVSARHAPSLSGNDAWRDTSVCVSGPNVSILQQAFQVAWEFNYDYFDRIRRQMKLITSLKWLRINFSESQSANYREQLVHELTGSKRRIWITNPYFAPGRKIARALRHAAFHGVDVRLLLPFKIDFFPSRFAAAYYYTALLKHGVKIYEYQPSILHAKILIVDDFATVGSSNLNHRSIFHDLEADVVISKPENIKRLTERFEADLRASNSIEFLPWQKRPFWTRALENFFFLFRRII
ncbi:MAG: hypothetical protein JST80_02170 [Bdellovibrionales bacterium]|nr:hypothetical protein [Bdellovibrionales bacterium]